MKLTLREYLLLGLIASTAIALRLYGLGMYGLWYDEIFSAEIARMPSFDLVIRTANDVHPPLYYLLLRGWNLLTGSEVDGTMRGLSVVLDLAAMGATAWLAWVAFGRRDAVWLALGLHAISPFAILYAQELRMYSLLLLATSLSFACMLRLAEKSSPWRVAAYLLTTFAALYTHIFAVFLVAAQNAWFLGRRSAPPALSRTRWLLTQVGLGLGFAPWGWVILRQILWAEGYRNRGEWWIPKPPLKALVGVPWVLLGSDWILLGLGGLLVIWVGFQLWKRQELIQSHRSTLIACALLFSVPIGLAFAVSHITTPIFVARFFTETLPALWLLLLAAVLSVSRAAVRWALVLALAVLNIRATFALNYEHSFKAPTPYREIIRDLANQPMARVVVDSSLSTASAWRWYSNLLPAGHTNLEPMAACDTVEQLAGLPLLDAPIFLMWPAKLSLPESFVDGNGRTRKRVSMSAYRELNLARYE